MCLGFPMTVVSGDETQALCRRGGDAQSVSMLLVGAQAPGTRVLVHLGAAMRVLADDEARVIDDALTGLAAALDGAAFDHYFADLIGREPELPEFLRERK
jgi:hydrogenase expression/formation protein HypC